MKSIKKANITKGMRVLVKSDMDVPFDSSGVISDTYRLDKTIHTLNYIIEKGGLPVLAGKIGRPGGKFEESLSTKKLEPYYDSKLGKGNYELLENLRFNPGEKLNDFNFAKELATKGEIFVNECFATAHREEASVVGLPKFLPSYAGFRLEEEVQTLKKVLENPDRPLIAIVGGAKIESKKPAVLKFLKIADLVLVGGKIGTDWDEGIPDNLRLPVDYAGDGKDIGQETIELYLEILSSAKTVVWAGPLGKFEEDEYMAGTRAIARELVASKTFSILGGGDTAAAVKALDLREKFSFVSTGGGAMLEFVIKGTLPGLEALGYYA